MLRSSAIVERRLRARRSDSPLMLLRAGVDESTAMKVARHKTRSMLLRYNIVTEQETAALVRADRYLSTQPAARNRMKRDSTGTVRPSAP